MKKEVELDDIKCSFHLYDPKHYMIPTLYKALISTRYHW